MISLKIAFHLLPLLPLYLGKYYFTAALVVLVIVAYIKCFKLRTQLLILQEAAAPNEESIRMTRKLLARWEALCFLKPRQEFPS